MKTYLAKMIAFLLLSGALASCKSSSDSNPTPVNTTTQTIADMISGIYSGTGEKTSDASTGLTSSSCTVPAGIANFIKQGAAQLSITKHADSTINITFSGGPFVESETHIRNITKNGNVIVLSDGLPTEVLTYNLTTKAISVGIDSDDSYFNTILSEPCQQGLPFYYGEQVTVNYGSPTATTEIGYVAVAYAEFSGSKQ